MRIAIERRLFRLGNLPETPHNDGHSSGIAKVPRICDPKKRAIPFLE